MFIIVDAVQLPLYKIDSFPTLGLNGVEDSLAYRTDEIEKHFHNRERWVGKKAVQTGTDWADDVLTPFQAISGNNDYGSDVNDEALVLGTDNTPIIPGNVKFDIRRFLITELSATTQYKLRIIYGTGTMGDAITANQYTEFVVINTATGPFSGGEPSSIMMPRLNCGIDQVWVQAWNNTNNATIDFLVGIHEYVG